MSMSMQLKFYDIPALMSVDQAIYNMVAMAKAENVVAVAVHNGIEIGATPDSKEQEVIAQWDLKKCEREVLRARLEPVRTAIRYLLSTISPEDAIVLVKELASDPLQQRGS